MRSNLTSKCEFVMLLLMTLHKVCYPGKYFIEVILLLSFESSSSEVYGRFSELLTYAVVG